MEIRPILILLALFVGAAAVADTYMWTNDEGIVHYSDRPHPGAKRIIIDTPNSSRALASRRTAAADDESTSEAAGPFRYESFEVAMPGPEDTLWNIEGTLSVTLSLSPGLQTGHQVRVYFNGQASMVNSTSFTLDEVHRGVHNIQAEVLDATGRLMIRSSSNRFYVQQNRVR